MFPKPAPKLSMARAVTDDPAWETILESQEWHSPDGHASLSKAALERYAALAGSALLGECGQDFAGRVKAVARRSPSRLRPRNLCPTSAAAAAEKVIASA